MQVPQEETLLNDYKKIQETHETRSAHARGSAAAHLFDIQPHRQPYLGRRVQVKVRKPLPALLPAGCLSARAQPHQSFDMQSPDIVQTDRAPHRPEYLPGRPAGRRSGAQLRHPPTGALGTRWQ